MSVITPYGEKLINLVLEGDLRAKLKERAKTLKTIHLSARSLCDLELLATGAFSPLNQFMGAKDYQNVLQHGRLANGILFPIPITLPIFELDLQIGEEVTLTDQYHIPLAVMRIEEKFSWDLEEEAMHVLQTLDLKHPLIREMKNHWGDHYIAGKLEVFDLPRHPDFVEYRYTPNVLRQMLEERGNPDVVAFQTRNPMHRAHEELTKQAMAKFNAILLLQPVVGLTKHHDVDYYARVRIYKTLINNYYPKGKVILSLLQLAMRMAGPREALLHAIIRRNYGANYFIIGRDHAGPGTDSKGKPFYGHYDAQELAKQHEKELGINIVTFNEFVYSPDENSYEESTKISPGKTFWTISGTQIREEYLNLGKPLPPWFTREECAKILVEAHPPKHKRGTCLWFTGLPCAGKTTIAEIVYAKLSEKGKNITFWDGDMIRKHLAGGLGFSLEEREIYLNRLGYIAVEITKHHGFIIVATVSPIKKTREHIRHELSAFGNFIEIFVDTSVEACSKRDVKGLYSKARKGEIKDYTGVSSPYEAPENPEIRLTTDNILPEENAKIVLDYLVEHGILFEE